MLQAHYVAELKDMIVADSLELSDVKYLLGALRRRKEGLEAVSLLVLDLRNLEFP